MNNSNDNCGLLTFTPLPSPPLTANRDLPNRIPLKSFLFIRIQLTNLICSRRWRF